MFLGFAWDRPARAGFNPAALLLAECCVIFGLP
jgi:hypothetical protein